ncbi:ABC transporter permease [Spartinivicinus ruber]|uniref:ABC transporter permease n=1 Tax=Spartinivicinus ruber TaxID=2683272 RepID=UPI0013D806A4|nr:ABC transporter permease [Spartinivicinus ruber]
MKAISLVATPRLAKFFDNLTGNEAILYQLVRQQLILRYRRTFFGYLWTLFNPLLMMSVTAVVFSTIFQLDLKTYAIFLFSGMVAFQFFATCSAQSGQSLLGNEQLIKKIYVTKLLFPLSVSFALLIDSILMASSLFIIILAIGGKITWAILFIPLSYLLIYGFSFGLGLILSVASVFFRDLQHIIAIVMQALLFLSPVFYKPESLAGKVKVLIELNPLTHYIELFRAPIYNGDLPSMTTVLMAALYSCISLALGIYVFRKLENRVAFRL